MKRFIILFYLVFLVSCSTSEVITQPHQDKKQKDRSINPDHQSKAIEHYTNGQLLRSQGEIEDALNEFYEALLYDQNGIEIYKSIASILLETKKYESALINLKKAQKIDSEDLEIMSMLGDTHLQMKKLSEAINDYKKILRIDSTHDKAFEMLLSIYVYTQNTSAAMALIESHGEHFWNNASISYNISGFYFKQKKYALAKKWIDRSLSVQPENQQTQLLAGEIEMIQGDSSKALDNLMNLYNKDPKNDRLLFNIVAAMREQKKHLQIIELLDGKPLLSDQLQLLLGESYYLTQKYKKVLTTYSKLPLNRTDVYFLYLAADSEFRLKNYESSFAYYQDIIEMNPAIAQGYYGAALCLVQQKNYSEAEKIIRTGLRKTKEQNALYQLLTETLVNLNKHQEASDYLANVVKNNPRDLNSLASVANAYQQINEFEKSDHVFEMALKQNPNNAIILNNYSYSLSKRSIKLEKALEMIEKALVISPNNHHYLDTIGWVYYKMKNYEKARIFTEKSMMTNTAEESFEVYDHLGDIYFALQDKEKALKYWKRALELKPDEENIREKITHSN